MKTWLKLPRHLNYLTLYSTQVEMTLTKKISLNPLRTSRTTFLICGTNLKILSGRRQRSIISS